MQKFAKLFVLVLCLTLVSSVWADFTVKGPARSLMGKNGIIENPNLAPQDHYVLPEVGEHLNPGSLDEVIISEGFEALSNGQLPTGWVQVDVDNATSPVTGFGGFSRWIVFSGTGYTGHGGTKFVANAYNDGAVANNDWLILPQQNLTGEITLSYWAGSQDPLYLETFEVRVSTTGATPADFTNLISTHANVPNAYTQYTDDLSAYAGAPFYIAFHYTSVDEFVLKLDDILLEAGEAAPTGTIAGTVTDSEGGAPLAGVLVQVTGGNSATTIANGTYSITAAAPGTYTVTFTKANYETETVENVAVTVDQTTTVNVAMTGNLPGDIVISEDFESWEEGTLPDGWTQISVDDGNCAQFARDSEWQVFDYAANAHGGTKVAMNHYNDGALPNNDWLILPQQILTGDISFSFWAASQDASFLESFSVKISTTGNQPANFTTTLQSFTNVPIAWAQHTFDLADYEGVPFYLAIHYTSTDEFVLKIDDVLLTGTAAPTGTISGVVTNSTNGALLSGVTVRAVGGPTSTTAADGTYDMTVAAGTYSLIFSKTGFLTDTVESVTVDADEAETVNLALSPSSAIGDDPNGIPTTFAFREAFPNPFNPSTQISFDVPVTTEATLNVFNSLGQKVATLVNGQVTAGSHTVEFVANDLPSGLYFAQLTAGSFVSTQKLVLMK